MTIDERIYNQAMADGMPPVLATLIVAQARHETAGYTSSVFKTCANCFGYKWVNQPTAAGACLTSTEGDPYARYTSIEQSTHELTLWIKRRQHSGVFPQDLTAITTADQYASLLKQANFFGAPVYQYTNGLLYWLSKIGTLPGAAVGGGAFLLLLIALGIAYRKKLFL